MMERWKCRKCGREVNERPERNAICNRDGCKGRFKREIQCKCGKWFEDKNRLYCSDECAGIKRTHIRIGKVQCRCEFCGKTITKYHSDIKKTVFCDKNCLKAYEMSKKEQRICKFCGKTFEVYKSAVQKTNASGIFCSTECYWESMKKERAEYSGFKKAKREYFSGKQFCAICGTTRGIQIHHIIPNRLTQDQRKKNLIPLCSLHHVRIERLTVRLHELFEDDYETELWYLNNILRTRQMITAGYIKEMQNG